MKADQIRSNRLQTLLKLALTGKYTWDDLEHYCIANLGVTRSTAKSYLSAVEHRLKVMKKI